MKIKECMSSNVQTIGSNCTTKEAARLMHDEHIGSLPVVDEGKLLGFITDRDICCKVVGIGRDAVMTQVHEVMTKEVTTCSEDQDITEAAKLMSEHRIRRLAVLGADSNMTGIVSVEDLARNSHELASNVLQAATPLH